MEAGKWLRISLKMLAGMMMIKKKNDFGTNFSFVVFFFLTFNVLMKR